MSTTVSTLPAQVRLDASGNGEVIITTRGPATIMHTRIQVAPVPPAAAVVSRPKATTYLNGAQFESTDSGHQDQSPTSYPMQAGDTISCVWTGGDPGALATMYVRGEFYG